MIHWHIDLSSAWKGKQQMDPNPFHLIEICVSYRFAQEHNWVIQGITGFLSAYYMEKPEFRVRRHYDELETGMHVWLCEIPSNMRVQGLLKRLTFDLPASQVIMRMDANPEIPRHVIDLEKEST